MKILLALLAALSLLAGGAANYPDVDAEDCVEYEGHLDKDGRQLVKNFHDRVAVGVTMGSSFMGSKLLVTSPSNNHSCDVFILSENLSVYCTNPPSSSSSSSSSGRNRPKVYNWPDVFSKDDTTQLWLQVVAATTTSLEGGPSSDLLLVGRRGRHQRHLLIPSTSLVPPLLLQWQQTEGMTHYYNCVTGCVYARSARTQEGDSTVFLRPGDDFLYLTLTSSGGSRGQLVINVTSDDLGSQEDHKNITLVWQDGKRRPTLGVLVDGSPLGDMTSYSALDEERHVEAQVGEGRGLVAACEHRFKGVAVTPTADYCKGLCEDLTTTEDLPTTTLYNPVDTWEGQEAEDSGRSIETSNDDWKLIFLVCLTLTFLGATIFLTFLNISNTSKLRRLQEDCRTPETSSTRVSTRRKDTVTNGNSYQSPEAATDVGEEDDVDNGKEEEDSHSNSEGTMALSDTVLTPMPTPGSLGGGGPRSPKIVSTKEFVDLELM